MPHDTDTARLPGAADGSGAGAASGPVPSAGVDVRKQGPEATRRDALRPAADTDRTRPLSVTPAPVPDAADQAHDPNEVTVQLDAVRIGGGDGDWSLQPAEVVPDPRREPNGPVFVDESGRRSRRFRRLGTLVGVACAVYAVVIVATLLTGNSSAPWVPLPEQQEAVPAGQGEASASPTASTDPSPTESNTPSPTTSGAGKSTSTPSRTSGPTASTSAPSSPAPSPTTGAPTPQTTATSAQPGTPDTATPAPTSPAPSGTPTGAPTTAPTTAAPTNTPDTTTSPAAGDPMALGQPAPTGSDVAAPSSENVL
ncbi:hypothetical protein [Streptomyces sp. NPDC058872]|uniref:hypothetical protein n=1 Tax=Streptomyces sp. NPDC058872 TaxID=3346661 RepID=UPI0036CF4BDC